MGGSTDKIALHVSATSWVHVPVALVVLVLGVLVYVLDRPSEAAPFLSAISAAHLLPNVFGRLGENLPTFAHVFAFSLLTEAWAGGGKRSCLLVCMTWFGIDSAFEIGQYPKISEQLVQIIPGWLEGLPILGQADAYFLSGTFDTRDLISIAVGAAAAYLVTAYIRPAGVPNE